MLAVSGGSNTKGHLAMPLTLSSEAAAALPRRSLERLGAEQPKGKPKKKRRPPAP